MKVYKACNIDGRFSHLDGKKAAVSYARSVERDESLGERELTEDYGWRFTKVSASHARAVGY
jgi:hypothetical protein